MLSDYIVGILIYVGLIAITLMFFNGAYRCDRYNKYEEEGESENENI